MIITEINAGRGRVKEFGDRFNVTEPRNSLSSDIRETLRPQAHRSRVKWYTRSPWISVRIRTDIFTEIGRSVSAPRSLEYRFISEKNLFYSRSGSRYK